MRIDLLFRGVKYVPSSLLDGITGIYMNPIAEESECYFCLELVYEFLEEVDEDEY